MSKMRSYAEIEIIKKSQTEMKKVKNTITELKNSI